MFKKAEHKRAKFAIIIGENEVKEGKLVIKNLATQEQFEIKKEELIDTAYNLLDQRCCGNCNCCEE